MRSGIAEAAFPLRYAFILHNKEAVNGLLTFSGQPSGPNRYLGKTRGERHHSIFERPVLPADP